MNKSFVFLFPGQGSQFVGMGKYLVNSPIAKKVFQEADDVLKDFLTRLMFEGPEDVLKQTQNAQPAILTVEIAIGRILLDHGIQPSIMAGHSLGEYACLVLSEAMTFADAVQAVRKRGQYMQEVVPLGKGTMAAVLGAEDAMVEKVCAEITAQGFLVEPANYNCPGQLVISGTVEGVEKASTLLKERGAKRCLPLQVSAPFHCSLLKPAGLKLGQDLEKISLKDPKVPYIANVDVKLITQASEIKSRLVEQVWSPVRWSSTLQKIAEEFNSATFIEVGPGKVVTGHMKKINEAIKVLSTDSSESLSSLLSSN